MNNSCSPNTSVRMFYELLGVRRRSSYQMCVRRVWTSSLSVFAPSFTPLPSHKASAGALLCRRLIRGRLVRDTRAIVLTLTVGHWNANTEHTKPNGVEEQQIFGQGFFFLFFLLWWSRPVYGRRNKVRADGRSAQAAKHLNFPQIK